MVVAVVVVVVVVVVVDVVVVVVLEKKRHAEYALKSEQRRDSCEPSTLQTSPHTHAAGSSSS